MNSHKHHRKMRSQGGGGHPSNILQVSPELHNLIHANPAVAYEHGLLVHSYDDPADVPVDIPGFLAELGHEHEHVAECNFCGTELHVKPKRKKFEGDERRKRKRITIAVPTDWEDGGLVWDVTLEQVKERLVEMGLYDSVEAAPAYESIIAALRDWLNEG